MRASGSLTVLWPRTLPVCHHNFWSGTISISRNISIAPKFTLCVSSSGTGTELRRGISSLPIPGFLWSNSLSPRIPTAFVSLTTQVITMLDKYERVIWQDAVPKINGGNHNLVFKNRFLMNLSRAQRKTEREKIGWWSSQKRWCHTQLQIPDFW